MTPREKLQAEIKRLGLSITAEFVPFSKSRNAREKHRNLNWKVTFHRKDTDAPWLTGPRTILTTDYMAGEAHCPAYKLTTAIAGGANSLLRREAIELETETGFQARVTGSGYVLTTSQRIEPDPTDVIWSLVQDADVLNYSSFEQWAQEFGYDPDSRSAEKIYRLCLEHALALRNAVGEDGLAALIEAGQDY
jgi:hypothetical protein